MSYLSELLAVKGIVSVWELGEAAGNAIDLADSNDGSYHLTPRAGLYEETSRGEPSLLPNGEGKSAKFSGASTSVIGSFSCPPVNDVFTFEAWIKLSKLGSGHNGIISRGTKGGYLRVAEDGKLELLKGQIAGILASAVKLSVGTIYHVAATKNGSQVRLFLNGEVIAEASTEVVCEAGNEGALGLARDVWAFGVSEPFHGTLQFCSQHHAALTPAEIKENYEAASASGYVDAILSRLSLLTLHELGETEGTKANDSMGRHHPSLLSSGEGRSVALAEDDYIEVPDAANLDVADNFSLQAVVVRSYPGKTGGIISRGKNGAYLRLSEGGKLELLKSNVAVILTSATALEFNRVYKVTATKNGKVAKIYIDGVLDAVTEVSGVTCEANAELLTIGADNSGGVKAEQANAIIQYAAIYNLAIVPGLITVKIMLGGKVQDKPRYVLVNGELLNR